MNFTKGLMLACGAVGAVLAAVSATELFFDFDGFGPPRDDGAAPLTVTLAPISLDLAQGGNPVQVSVLLTVPGRRAYDAVCGHATVLRTAAVRLIARQAGRAEAARRAVPPDFDRALRARIADAVGGSVVERVEVTVTPAGGVPPPANCPGT